MVEVVETITPYSKGFEFLWTIDKENLLTGLFDSARSHVLFRAFEKRWRLEASSRLKSYKGGKQLLFIKMHLVDKEGNFIEKIDDAENDPYFNGSQYRASISFFSNSGKLLPPYVVSKELPPNKQEECVFFTQFDMENATIESILQQTNGGESKAIQMHFEFRVWFANRNDLYNVTLMGIPREKLFDEGKFTDFVIQTGDRRKILAHRLVLDAASSYFEAMFRSGGRGAQKEKIDVPESFPVMNEIVRFLYTGKAPQKEQFGSALNIVDLYVAADKYKVTGLKDHLEDTIDSLFSTETVCDALVKAHLEEVECMKKKAAEFIGKRQTEVIKSEGFRQLCAAHPTLVAFVFNSLGAKDIVDLYPIAADDKNQLTAFKEFLEKAFEALLSVQSATDQLVQAHKGGIECLKNKAADFIRAQRNEVFGTKGWIELCRYNPDLVAFLFSN